MKRLATLVTLRLKTIDSPMTDKPKAIKALIFMKGQSERVPEKNMRLLCGRPLFHWIMDSLTASKYIDEIIINTDCDKIAQSASENFGATIHMRPEHLLVMDSNESNRLIDYDLSKADGQYFIQTHSTNPLVTTKSIDNAIETFFNLTDHDSLMSVTEVYKRFYFADGKPVNHDPKNVMKTQDLPPIYEENSSFYIFSKNSFAKEMNRVGENPYFFALDAHEAADIDDPIDFSWAEFLMEKRLAGK